MTTLHHPSVEPTGTSDEWWSAPTQLNSSWHIWGNDKPYMPSTQNAKG